jgi:hypothetical protein
MESDTAEGSGTIALVLSDDGSSITQVNVTITNSSAECSNGSKGTVGFGSMEVSFSGPWPITDGNIDASLFKGGELKGKFTSPTEASGTIHVLGGVSLLGSPHTCDFGTWNWDAKAK